MSEDFLPESVKGGGMPVVEIAESEGGTYVASKTFAEISALIEAGQLVALKAAGSGIMRFLWLEAYIPNTVVQFTSASGTDLDGVFERGTVLYVSISADNSIKVVSGYTQKDT